MSACKFGIHCKECNGKKTIKYKDESAYFGKSSVNGIHFYMLSWDEGFITFPNMVRFNIPGDGNCFFNSIAYAYLQSYKTGKNPDGSTFNRKEVINKFRYDLSRQLPEHYNSLSRGKLLEISKEVPQYSLENMINELNSNSAVDNIYNEYVSNIYNKDIYLIDILTRDIYITGDDSDILYKDRESIVLLVCTGHYDVLGVMIDDSHIRTCFQYDDPFIELIRNRIKEKINLGSST